MKAWDCTHTISSHVSPLVSIRADHEDHRGPFGPFLPYIYNTSSFMRTKVRD